MSKKSNSGLKPGQVMEDGTVYAGSTKSGQQIFTTPTDLSVTATFNEANEAFAKMNEDKAHGHDDWRMPTKEELHVLRHNRRKGALKDSWRTAGSGKGQKFTKYHWSSGPKVENDDEAYTYRFSPIPSWSWFGKENKISARPIRLG